MFCAQFNPLDPIKRTCLTIFQVRCKGEEPRGGDGGYLEASYIDTLKVELGD